MKLIKLECVLTEEHDVLFNGHHLITLSDREIKDYVEVLKTQEEFEKEIQAIEKRK